MNVSEFCKEYDIPRGVVYEASFWLDDRKNFAPVEMIRILRNRIHGKIRFHQENIEKLEAMLMKLEKVK